MLESVVNGNGAMAQFSHPEFGGSGQWMRGGMIMVSDMFNNYLKGRRSWRARPARASPSSFRQRRLRFVLERLAYRLPCVRHLGPAVPFLGVEQTDHADLVDLLADALQRRARLGAVYQLAVVVRRRARPLHGWTAARLVGLQSSPASVFTSSALPSLGGRCLVLSIGAAALLPGTSAPPGSGGVLDRGVSLA